MSPRMLPLDRAAELAHERARMLAAESVDAALGPGDAEWLDGHLGACPDCAAVAEEYLAIHAELRSLALPEPPRDLWARTAAGFDRIDAGAAQRFPSAGAAAGVGRRPLVSTAVAVAVVVVMAVASLLVQSPILSPVPGSTRTSTIALATVSSAHPSGGPQAPLTVVNGTSYWIASDAGVYQIKGGTAQCSATDGSCTVAGGTGQTLGSIASDSGVSAVIAPDARSAAVWTNDKVAILPLAAQPQTVSLDLLTPRPTNAATPTVVPVATATPTATPAATSTATHNGTQAPEGSSAASILSPTPAPSVAPTRTPTPTVSPKASASPTGPIAILTGYEIVGRDPEFSADGTQVAFSARPVDHSTGPDVFVWRSGDETAERVTFRDADMFAGWFGGRILISEISVATAPGAATTAPGGTDALGSTSYVFDPSTGTYWKIDRPMLLPAVDPTGRYLVYWSGSVQFDPVSGLWQPGNGDLHFDTWADLTLTEASLAPMAAPESSTRPASDTPSLAVVGTPPPTPTPISAPTAAEAPSASPSATAAAASSVAAASQRPAGPTLPQWLPVSAAPGKVHAWAVRWDAAGGHVAVWVAGPNSSKVGRLSLFSVDQTTGLVDTNEPLLAADKVMASITFDDGHLVYTSAVDGKTYIQAVPAVPPSTVSTVAPTTPGQLPTGPIGSGTPAPQATDRPGN